MASRHFRLITNWHLDAPAERVWGLLRDVESWPEWWPSVKSVERKAAGDRAGIGSVHRLRWATALPYDVSFEMRTRVEPMVAIEGRAVGELDGTGLWTVEERSRGTSVRYDWTVDITRAWMRRAAPALRPLFAWNHNVVMERGRLGMMRKLTGHT